MTGPRTVSMPTTVPVAGRADAAHTTLRNVNGRAGQRPARQFVPMATQTDFSPPRASVTPDADLILVIDDEPQIRRAVRDALRDVTAKVDEAANGADGVNAATSARPDLVVLDLGLPDMAGVDVCREIRRRSAVPIIVLVGAPFRARESGSAQRRRRRLRDEAVQRARAGGARQGADPPRQDVRGGDEHGACRHRRRSSSTRSIGASRATIRRFT